MIDDCCDLTCGICGIPCNNCFLRAGYPSIKEGDSKVINIPTPEEQRAKKLRDSSPQIQSLTNKIVSNMEKCDFDGSPLIISLEGGNFNTFVRATVKRALELRGWEVQAKSDQRAGDWWEISPRSQSSSIDMRECMGR